MKKLPVAVICPETCYEGAGDNKRLYFEKGKKYKITSIENACVWKGCSFLSAGLVWIPVYSLEEEQLEFQF